MHWRRKAAMARMSARPSGVVHGARRRWPLPSPERESSVTGTDAFRSLDAKAVTTSARSSFSSQARSTGGRPATSCHAGDMRRSVDGDGDAADGSGSLPTTAWAARRKAAAVMQSPGTGSPARKLAWTSSSRSARGDTSASPAAGRSPLRSPAGPGATLALRSRSVDVRASQDADGDVARMNTRGAPVSPARRRCERCSCMISWLVGWSSESSGTTKRAPSAEAQWQAILGGAGGDVTPSSHSTTAFPAAPCATTSHQTTPPRVDRSALHH
mmetsp:Transcript_7021/g.20755  ORF Transcript_7021/g.20755 Transcript_7021/m.20755 type:complete len:271 (-) Transcript_7021:403-1215(-)